MSKFDYDKFKKWTCVLIYVILALIYSRLSIHYMAASTAELDNFQHAYVIAAEGYAVLLYEAKILLVIASIRVIVGLIFKQKDILGIVTIILMILRLITFDYSIFHHLTFDRDSYFYYFDRNTWYYIVNDLIGNFYFFYLIFVVLLGKYIKLLINHFFNRTKIENN